MTRTINVEAVEITDVRGLDPIQVFWMDLGNGRGHATITCYGCAWTVYFNSMGTSGTGNQPCTIREFFMHADTSYMVSKLGITPMLKQRARDYTYLARIIDAIKIALQEVAAVSGRAS